MLEDASLDLHGHVVATFAVTEDDVPLTLGELTALAPRFTLAKLTDHPADGLRAWESLILTGKHVAPTLRPGGPDDPEVLTSVRQPGPEIPASLIDLGEGRFRYVFATAVTGFDPGETLRVGMWLSGVESGSLRTATTHDFRPSDGPVEALDTVLDVNCASCHGSVVAHETIAGVRLCLTCHTWQNVDTLTIDPAALVTTGTTARTNPNPLELGRMLHRIHRGKDLPTLYTTAWDGVSLSSTTVPFAPNFAPPYVQQKPGSPVRAVLPGRKYSIVRADGHEVMFAQSLTIPSADPTLGATMLLASGGLFPRDLRDCAVCHGDAPQGDVVKFGITRRTCSGCHPEVWFQASSPAADRVRYPHPGGAQADDTQCLGCHVTGTPRLYAPVEEVHLPPARAPRYNQPFIEIVRVDDLAPGKRPKVTFRLFDRVGPIAPSPSAPLPAFEPDVPGSSYVPRKFNAAPLPASAATLTIKVMGPTTPDYSTYSGVLLTSGLGFGNPDPAALSTSSNSDEYVYTFSSIVPPGTAGTFLVGMEGRRFLTPSGDPRLALRQDERCLPVAVHRRDGERDARERDRVRERGERHLDEGGRVARRRPASHRGGAAEVPALPRPDRVPQRAAARSRLVRHLPHAGPDRPPAAPQRGGAALPGRPGERRRDLRRRRGAQHALQGEHAPDAHRRARRGRLARGDQAVRPLLLEGVLLRSRRLPG